MTNAPEKKITYKTPKQMEALASRPEITAMLSKCVRREHSRETFWPSKATNPGTVEQWGETYRDDTGFRASIFYFTHDDGSTVRSVQRIVTDDADFRLSMPPANPSNLLARVQRGIRKIAKNTRR